MIKTKRRVQVILISLLSVFLGVILWTSISSSTNFSDASFGLCGNLGSGLGEHTQVDVTEVVAPDATGRKWTVQELFANSLKFTSYNGEGDSTWYFAKTGDRGGAAEGWDDSKVQEKVKSIRTIPQCLTGGLKSGIPNIILAGSSNVLGWSRSFVTKLFSPNIICTSSDQRGGCLNLLGVIGGKNNNGGIIGSLRDSIFTPLATLAFIFVALWLMYKGLIKREFRTSLMGVIWSVAIFLIGVIALNRTTMLASAPQKINSALSTCIVGAMNGQNCLSGEVTAPSTLVGEECVSTANVKNNEGAEMAVNGMSCSIWKTFVLESWAKAEFGTSYSDLYIANPPEDGEIMPNAPKNKDIYGVSLKSAGSAESFKNGTVQTSGSPMLYNLALYQLYISTNMKSSNDPQWNDKANDPRWFNIIVPVAKNDNMWNYWAPTGVGGVVRISSSLTGFVISSLVAISLIIFSFWGLVYMFTGTILMAFAPLFLLLAIEPSKGRRIFLGWLESLVSSILKYLGSALIVIVAMSLYSAILSTAKNGATAFVGILVMVGVMMMYRKEIINLLGMSNLGGQRVSNAVGDRINKKANRTKEFGATVAGSMVGGTAAAMIMNRNSTGDKVSVAKHAMKGMGSGTMRQLRRGQGVVAGAARQIDASKREVASELENKKRVLAEQNNENETNETTTNEYNDLNNNNNDNNNNNKAQEVINKTKQNKTKQQSNNEPKVNVKHNNETSEETLTNTNEVKVDPLNNPSIKEQMKRNSANGNQKFKVNSNKELNANIKVNTEGEIIPGSVANSTLNNTTPNIDMNKLRAKTTEALNKAMPKQNLNDLHSNTINSSMNTSIENEGHSIHDEMITKNVNQRANSLPDLNSISLDEQKSKELNNNNLNENHVNSHRQQNKANDFTASSNDIKEQLRQGSSKLDQLQSNENISEVEQSNDVKEQLNQKRNEPLNQMKNNLKNSQQFDEQIPQNNNIKDQFNQGYNEALKQEQQRSDNNNQNVNKNNNQNVSQENDNIKDQLNQGRNEALKQEQQRSNNNNQDVNNNQNAPQTNDNGAHSINQKSDNKLNKNSNQSSNEKVNNNVDNKRTVDKSAQRNNINNQVNQGYNESLRQEQQRSNNPNETNAPSQANNKAQSKPKQKSSSWWGNNEHDPQHKSSIFKSTKKTEPKLTKNNKLPKQNDSVLPDLSELNQSSQKDKSKPSKKDEINNLFSKNTSEQSMKNKEVESKINDLNSQSMNKRNNKSEMNNFINDPSEKSPFKANRNTLERNNTNKTSPNSRKKFDLNSRNKKK